jgi:hypothetical protein
MVRLVRFFLRGLAGSAFVIAVAWSLVLLVALAEMYIFRTFPYGFADWVVSMQTRSELWQVTEYHSRVYYLTRFAVSTILIEALGAAGYLYLRRAGRKASAPG